METITHASYSNGETVELKRDDEFMYVYLNTRLVLSSTIDNPDTAIDCFNDLTKRDISLEDIKPWDR